MKRHGKWLLIPQDDGDCKQCVFHIGPNYDCNAKSTWKKCTVYNKTQNGNIVSTFYRYGKSLELSINSRTL